MLFDWCGWGVWLGLVVVSGCCGCGFVGFDVGYVGVCCVVCVDVLGGLCVLGVFVCCTWRPLGFRIESLWGPWAYHGFPKVCPCGPHRGSQGGPMGFPCGFQ